MSKYTDSIDMLIPKAEEEANRIATLMGKKSENRPGVDGNPYTYCYFTEFFHKAMNRMAKEKGLR